MLTSWSAGGSVHHPDQLLAALAVAGGEGQVEVDHAWNLADVRRRASRVLWSLLLDNVVRLPDRVQDWLAALPAVSVASVVATSRPAQPVNWLATVRLNQGWPPPRGIDKAQFVGRRRDRVADDVMVSTLRWAAARLIELQDQARMMLPEVTRQAVGQAQALRDVREVIGPGTEFPPSVWELAALDASGEPWNRLADVARHLLALENDLYAFALHVIWPDESLRGRLFQLAVYGELLGALRAANYVIEARAPLGGSAKQPNHVAVSWAGDDVELWFEASGAWDHYGGSRTAYKTASAGVGGQASLSPDCLAVRVDTAGDAQAILILECKDSADKTYVARNGYLQALAYGTEFAVAARSNTFSYTIGPGSVVAFTSQASIFGASTGLRLQVGVAPASKLAGLVTALLK